MQSRTIHIDFEFSGLDNTSFLHTHLSVDYDKHQDEDGHFNAGHSYIDSIHEMANYLFKQVRSLANGDKGDGKEKNKVSIVISGEAEGCLSALIFAKKIADDKELNQRVEIFLNLKDPVVSLHDQVDASKAKALVKKLSDMKDCKCIKQVSITHREDHFKDGKKCHRLHSKFSAHTKLESEDLPEISYEYNSDGSPADRALYHMAAWRDLFLQAIGECKQLQLQIESDATMKMSMPGAIRKRVPGLIQFLAKSNYDKIDEAIADIVMLAFMSSPLILMEAIDDVYAFTHKGRFENVPNRKAAITEFLNELQVRCYNAILAIEATCAQQVGTGVFKSSMTDKHVGKFKDGPHKPYNERHAQLLSATENTPAHKTSLSLKQSRVDFRQLKDECDKYEFYLLGKFLKAAPGSIEHEKFSEKLTGIRDLASHLRDKDAPMSQRIKNFNDAFIKLAPIFASPRDREFIRNAGHLIASIVSLGIYAVVRALHSKATRGYGSFWKTHKRVFAENADELLKDAIPHVDAVTSVMAKKKG